MIKRICSAIAIAAMSLNASSALAVTATYYSSSYEGARTASGEVFSNWGYTAAHPYLPFGTTVRVTNRANGRSVNVRINDRCSCGIDLSQAAAEAIGSLSQGVYNVDVVRLD